MKLSSVRNTLFLKDLLDSSTFEEFIENPHRMEFKSENEPIIYAPKFVRGEGVKREGYCQVCDKWFRMKTSSYWYHMNYKHGINSKGEKYPEPIFRDLNFKVQSFCKICDEWITLGTSRKTSKFLWKRHFQKEHSIRNSKI